MKRSKRGNAHLFDFLLNLSTSTSLLPSSLQLSFLLSL
jgi:hypothetical protein